jgi:hypothetical protein
MCEVSVSDSGVGTVYSPMKYESSKKRLFLDYTEEGGTRFLRNFLNIYKSTWRHNPQRFYLSSNDQERHQSRL